MDIAVSTPTVNTNSTQGPRTPQSSALVERRELSWCLLVSVLQCNYEREEEEGVRCAATGRFSNERSHITPTAMISVVKRLQPVSIEAKNRRVVIVQASLLPCGPQRVTTPNTGQTSISETKTMTGFVGG